MYDISRDGSSQSIIRIGGPSIQDTEAVISNLETSEILDEPTSLDAYALISLYNSHSAHLKQNSIHWAQRARLLSLQNRDFNTNSSHNVPKVRNHRNRIFDINLDDAGTVHLDFKSIA